MPAAAGASAPTREASPPAWGKITDPVDLRHVRAVVSLLSARLGPVSRTYLGQGGNVIGMSFGRATKVGLYVSPELLSVGPEAVVDMGGHEALAEMYPGFTHGKEQRHAEARFELSGYRNARSRRVERSVDRGLHCDVQQPLGTDCMYCGERVTAV